ncbi:Mn-containing catalase [Paenibacillus alvei DSM 29]|nr:Mn-containing catalase [Paenibacillus alvei DSM 29]
MIATMVHKLTKDATPQQLEEAGLGPHFVAHEKALFYSNAAGDPWTATYIQAKGEPIVYLDTTIPCNADRLTILDFNLCNK